MSPVGRAATAPLPETIGYAVRCKAQTTKCTVRRRGTQEHDPPRPLPCCRPVIRPEDPTDGYRDHTKTTASLVPRPHPTASRAFAIEGLCPHRDRPGVRHRANTLLRASRKGRGRSRASTMKKTRRVKHPGRPACPSPCCFSTSVRTSRSGLRLRCRGEHPRVQQISNHTSNSNPPPPSHIDSFRHKKGRYSQTTRRHWRTTAFSNRLRPQPSTDCSAALVLNHPPEKPPVGTYAVVVPMP